MAVVSSILSGALATVHVYIVYLEMFLWTAPEGRKAFNLTADFADKSKSLAANMGLYNGFLAAGLIWGLVHPVEAFRTQIRVFFLGCVTVAGLFGAATSSKKILFVQFVPGSVALAATLLGF